MKKIHRQSKMFIVIQLLESSTVEERRITILIVTSITHTSAAARPINLSSRDRTELKKSWIVKKRQAIRRWSDGKAKSMGWCCSREIWREGIRIAHSSWYSDALSISLSLIIYMLSMIFSLSVRMMRTRWSMFVA